jgi:hypothetical protein
MRTDNDDWDEPDYEDECEECGEVRPVRILPNPFIAEVYPEDEPEKRAYCRPCWLRHKDDI